MKKPYIKPELECLLVSSAEDILSFVSPGIVEDEVTDGEWETGPDDPWA